MERNSDTEAIIHASFYFHELFKKAVLASVPLHEFTRTQMDMLIALHADGPMNMSTLSEKVGIAPEQATRAMRALKDHRFVETERNEENRRMVIASLTNQGELLMIEHFRTLDENLQATLAGLTEEEAHQLAQTAKTIVELMGKTGLRHIVPQNPSNI